MAFLYKRGNVWWVKSYRNGRMVRTSLKTTDRAEARRRMRGMESQHASTLQCGTCVITSITWDTAAQDLLAYYRAYGTRNAVEAEGKLKQLTQYFAGIKLGDIDAATILSAMWPTGRGSGEQRQRSMLNSRRFEERFVWRTSSGNWTKSLSFA